MYMYFSIYKLHFLDSLVDWGPGRCPCDAPCIDDRFDAFVSLYLESPFYWNWAVSRHWVILPVYRYKNDNRVLSSSWWFVTPFLVVVARGELSQANSSRESHQLWTMCMDFFFHQLFWVTFYWFSVTRTKLVYLLDKKPDIWTWL